MRPVQPTNKDADQEERFPLMTNMPERFRRTAAALALVLLAAAFCAAQDPEASTAAFKKLEAADFSKKAVTRDQLKPLELWDLRMLRGVVFGRHGRVFKDRDIQT